MWQKFSINKSFGFALVELMIACALVATITITLLSYGQKGLGLSSMVLRQTQAAYLLEEGAEAVKTLRDADWANMSSLSVGTEYYLDFNTTSGMWELSTTASMIDGLFTRKIVFSSVYRDANDDIVSSGGTLDSGSLKVLVSVSWMTSEGANSKNLTFYVFDILS